MFYSSSREKIDSSISYLVHDQVFSGQYCDEFGLTAHLIPASSTVLMLGLAYGGGIKPLLSGNADLQLTAVDMNDQTNAECKEIFHRNYPELQFTAVTSSAQAYISTTNETFNAIWVDVYGPESYLAELFENQFYTKLKKCLKPGGLIFVNSYGLPFHLASLTRDHVHTAMGAVLQKNFQHVHVYPYRRNQTFVASDSAICAFPTTAHPSLRLADQVVHSLHALRVRHPKVLAATAFPTTYPLRFAEIDQQMRNGWKQFIAVMNSYVSEGEQFHEVVQLRELFKNFELCKAILGQMVQANEAAQIFFAIFVAGEMNCSQISADWFLTWFFENAETLQRHDSERFIQIYLPQVLAILLNPEGRYKRYLFTFSNLLSSLSGESL